MKKEVESKSTTTIVRVHFNKHIGAFVDVMSTLVAGITTMPNRNGYAAQNDAGYVTFVIYGKEAPEHLKALRLDIRNEGHSAFYTWIVNHEIAKLMPIIDIIPITNYEHIVKFVKAHSDLLLWLIEYNGECGTWFPNEQSKETKRKQLIRHVRRTLKLYCNRLTYST